MGPRLLRRLPGLASSTNRINAILGVGAFSLAVAYWFLIPQAVPLEHAAMGITGRFFPRMASLIVGASGLALAARALFVCKGSEDASGGIKASDLRRIAPYFILTLAYVALIDVIGYLTSTILALAIFLWLAGQRNWLAIAGVATAVPTALYLLFEHVMQVPLPKGLLL